MIRWLGKWLLHRWLQGELIRPLLTQAEIYYKTVRFYVETPKSFGPVKFSTSFGGINISVASLQLS